VLYEDSLASRAAEPSSNAELNRITGNVVGIHLHGPRPRRSRRHLHRDARRAVRCRGILNGCGRRAVHPDATVALSRKPLSADDKPHLCRPLCKRQAADPWPYILNERRRGACAEIRVADVMRRDRVLGHSCEAGAERSHAPDRGRRADACPCAAGCVIKCNRLPVGRSWGDRRRKGYGLARKPLRGGRSYNRRVGRQRDRRLRYALH